MSVSESSSVHNGSELSFGGESEEKYSLPSLEALCRKSATQREPALPAHTGAPIAAPQKASTRPPAAYSHGSGVMWPFY